MSVRLPIRECGLVLVAALLAVPAFAQDDELREELKALKEGQEEIQRQMGLEQQIEALKQGQEEIQKQLAELKQLMQARPAAGAPARPAGPAVAGKIFDLRENPVVGAQTAKLTLVEFTDYQ